jgi:hypothetical protein
MAAGAGARGKAMNATMPAVPRSGSREVNGYRHWSTSNATPNIVPTKYAKLVKLSGEDLD